MRQPRLKLANGELVIERITQEPVFRKLAGRLKKPVGAVSVEGLWGSSAPITTAALSTTAESGARPILYVTAHFEEADNVRDDMELVRREGLELLPAWESLPGEGGGSQEIAGERLRLLHRLTDGQLGRGFVVVAPIQSLMQPVPNRSALENNTIELAVGQTHDPRKLADWLENRSFQRLDLVEQAGDYSLRGGIVDVFCPGDTSPVRIEFFDDRIDSIRWFDPSTQRSDRKVDRVRLLAAPDGKSTGHGDRTSFFECLPSDTIIVLDEPAEVQEMGRTFWKRLGQPRSMYTVEQLLQQANAFDCIYLARLAAPVLPTADQFRFDVTSLQRFEAKAADAIDELIALSDRQQVFVYCDNQAERQRFGELLAERAGAVPKSMHLKIGMLHRGFEWASLGMTVVAHHEIFHRHSQRRRIRRIHASRPIESWLDLEKGDYVVHVVHGIARFMGMRTMRKAAGHSEEFLTLQFAEKAAIHVPTAQIDLVQKYIGAGGIRPQLSKLGGTRWRKTKERVQDAVADLAGELLAVQATRSARPGIAYPKDTEWQKEFEGAFPYAETEDQLTVMEEIRHDLTRGQPMDRLVCGDVGYGKTELAMRAAFKVVEYGKQVAVLVPTTVLAEQHFQTFSERMADYPFYIAVLSRFRTKGEQDKIIKRAKKGQIDILIGTHRLLSRDVDFADLGLVIIDEEQRFGVEHKEHLKHLRETVDVLTLTATPIPRTLHMSMLGIKDISSLATPPLDRRAIVTQVRAFDRELIRNAVVREMNRDGQVYLVHNFVHDIHVMADVVKQCVPEARIVVGHGQMKEHELEQVMLKFVNHEADVLVCTNIIESGIDIPNVNTILLNRADRFGLADLHQLRGRVGRYKHRAYCYLLLSPDKPITSKAGKRLKAIEEYSMLGAGFRIAMRDLEIRGAGNILGPEQSGHIAAVGYEMYCQLLENAVRRLKDEGDIPLKAIHLDLGISAHIPRSYLASDRSRIEVYRRIAGSRSIEELEQLEADLRDAYGPFPETVGRLLQMAEIRVLAQRWGIGSIILREPDIVFSIDSLTQAKGAFEGAPGTVRMPDPRTIHLRLPPAYLEAPTMLAILRKLLRQADRSPQEGVTVE